MSPAPLPPAFEQRLALLVHRGGQLQREGLGFPTEQVAQAVQVAAARGDLDEADVALKRAEVLMERVQKDWSWLRGLLTRAEEMREVAEHVGLGLDHLDARVGNPRLQLSSGPLSGGGLERAAASASFSLAVLNDALPKFLVEQSRSLGETLRSARRRGEESDEARERLTRLLRSLREGDLQSTAERFLEFRTAVRQIRPAPVFAGVSPREEEEILQEARNLARRLHQIKGRARDARTAAKLVSQVRAALSEDRRYGTPEEEIEELWSEVDRLTRERVLASPEEMTPPEGEEGMPPEKEEIPVPFADVPAYLDTRPPPAVYFGGSDPRDDPRPDDRRRRSPPPVEAARP